MCLSMMWYWVYFFCLSPIFSSLSFRSLSCVVELSMPTVSTSQDLLTSKLSMLIFVFLTLSNLFRPFKVLSSCLAANQAHCYWWGEEGEREGERERRREGEREGREGGREGGKGGKGGWGGVRNQWDSIVYYYFLTPCSNDFLSMLSITLVRSGIYHLLGVLCEQFPEHLVKIAPRLIDIYMTNLKTEVK